jgi:hypothetical protein
MSRLTTVRVQIVQLGFNQFHVLTTSRLLDVRT